MMTDPAEVTALALWVALWVAYLRRLFGPLVRQDRLPGIYGPPLAFLVAEITTVGSWWLGLRAGDWRQAVVAGLQVAIAAMGGYSGLKELVNGTTGRANGGAAS